MLHFWKYSSKMAADKEKPRKRDYIKKQIKIITEKSKIIAAQGEASTQYVIAATKNGNTIFRIVEKNIQENGKLVFLVDKPYFMTDSLQYTFVQGASKVLLPLAVILDTVKVGSIAGGWAGGAAGAYGGGEAGAAIGGTIGAFFGGIGAVPGAAVGAVCGTIVGAIGGGVGGSIAAEKVAQTVADQYYGVPLEDVEILKEENMKLWKRKSKKIIELTSQPDCRYHIQVPQLQPDHRRQLENIGHTLKFIPSDQSPNVEMEGGDLGGKYRFLQYHLHWSQKSGEGSEHSIAGLYYDAELHLVHYAIDDQGNATTKLAVLGIF
uniref:Carbonic anhydrase n=1 Tax=Ditylenchus dipsaci TaxID=166011 RepID=A0A915DK03_9BILA